MINLILGLLLVLIPAGILEYFGLPPTNSYFYSSILGGVIIGIGVALGLELLRNGRRFRGLGLAGAIAINLCGGGTLLYWLFFGKLEIPLNGSITLWILAILVVGIGLVVLFRKYWMEE